MKKGAWKAITSGANTYQVTVEVRRGRETEMGILTKRSDSLKEPREKKNI